MPPAKLTIRTRAGTNLNRTLGPRSIDVVLAEASRYWDSGRPERAAMGFRQILEVQPGHVTALRRYGRLLYARRDYVEAAAIYQRLAEVQADESAAWQGLGRALLAVNDFAAAEKALRQATELLGRPSFGDLVGLGRTLHGQHRMQEAQQVFQSALALEPETAAEQQPRQEIRQYLPPDAVGAGTNTANVVE